MAVNFFWGTVRCLLLQVDVMIRVSTKKMDLVEVSGGYSSPRIKNDPELAQTIQESIEIIDSVVQASEQLFSGLRCEHINRAAKSLGYWRTTGEQRWSELNTRSRSLRDAIETELKQYFYYQYPKHKGQKLESWRKDWNASVRAFPDIEKDVFAATDCYALGHSTASVFHSMRVAEHGLRSLAKERKLRLPKNKPVEWGAWQEIIRELDNEIKVVGGRKAGAAKDDALAFYSGARSELNGFKDEYRNLVSHVRASYDELQALRALTTVNAFMERLAAKIDHRHHRIRWGLR